MTISAFGGPWKIVARVLRTSGEVDLVGRRERGLEGKLAGEELMRVLRGKLDIRWRSCLRDSAWAHSEGDLVKAEVRRIRIWDGSWLARMWEG